MQSAQCNIWSTCSRIMSHDDDDDDDAVVIAVSLCLQKTKTILAPYLTVLASVTTPTLSSHHACHSASSSLQGRRAPTPQPPSSARGPHAAGTPLQTSALFLGEKTPLPGSSARIT